MYRSAQRKSESFLKSFCCHRSSKNNRSCISFTTRFGPSGETYSGWLVSEDNRPAVSNPENHCGLFYLRWIKCHPPSPGPVWRPDSARDWSLLLMEEHQKYQDPAGQTYVSSHCFYHRGNDYPVWALGTDFFCVTVTQLTVMQVIIKISYESEEVFKFLETINLDTKFSTTTREKEVLKVVFSGIMASVHQLTNTMCLQFCVLRTVLFVWVFLFKNSRQPSRSEPTRTLHVLDGMWQDVIYGLQNSDIFGITVDAAASFSSLFIIQDIEEAENWALLEKVLYYIFPLFACCLFCFYFWGYFQPFTLCFNQALCYLVSCQQ